MLISTRALTVVERNLVKGLPPISHGHNQMQTPVQVWTHLINMEWIANDMGCHWMDLMIRLKIVLGSTYCIENKLLGEFSSDDIDWAVRQL